MKYQPAEILEVFAEVARPMILQFFPPNSCIAAARTTLECLKRFSVDAYAEPVRFVVKIEELNLAFTTGLSEDERRRAISDADSWFDAATRESGWNGHLIVLAVNRRYLVDPTFDQAFYQLTQAGKLIEPLEPLVLVLPLDEPATDRFGITFGARFSNGLNATVMYDSIADKSFLEAPAWERDHLQPLIYSIVRRMRETLARKASKE